MSAHAVPLRRRRRWRDLAFSTVWCLALAGVGTLLGFAVVAWIEAMVNP